DPLDDVSTQEDGERDGAVPEVVARQDGGVGRPPGLSAGEAVEARCEPCGNAPEQIVRVDAVVVRKGDGVGPQVRERCVPRTREPARRAQSFDSQRAMAL